MKKKKDLDGKIFTKEEHMPNYDYRCPKCDKFTVHQGIKEKALELCPECGSPVERLIGKNVNIVFKGSGFYATDSKPAFGSMKKDPDALAARLEGKKKNNILERSVAKDRSAVNDSKPTGGTQTSN